MKRVLVPMLLVASGAVVGPLNVGPAHAAVTCDGLLPTITGTDGPDTIRGTPGRDVIAGLAGDDVISGVGGSDLLCGGPGADILNGGPGTDTVSYAESPSRVVADLTGSRRDDGSIEDESAGARDSIRADVEQLFGGPWNDRLTGGPKLGELLRGRDNDDVLSSGEPDGDPADPTALRDILYGGAGMDALMAGGGSTLLYGQDDEDSLRGGPGPDVLHAGLGDDDVASGDGDDIIGGGPGQDFIRTGEGDDLVVGGGDFDDVSAGPGDDTIRGGAGDDFLEGREGDDTLTGGLGNDYLNGYHGADRTFGGPGYDIAGYRDAGRFAGVTVSIGGPAGMDGGSVDGPAGVRDTVHGTIEEVDGTDRDDVLIGNAYDNFLFGAGGSDRLYGRGGDDTLYTRDGVADTVIDCGAGADTNERDAADPAPIDCENLV